MVLQIDRPAKGFGTECTTVWFLTRVNYKMTLKTGQLREGFVTQRTTKWLLSGMTSYMLL
jgi:hypothetical protein